MRLKLRISLKLTQKLLPKKHAKNKKILLHNDANYC